ncbi:MAG TPA: hypothetical protein VMV69_14275 [Pirellulales bacterium]|nr:hypothetical protein [Pirellulales bacterium]
MTGGEWATRWTIRLALLCYFVATMAEMTAAADERRQRLACALWTAGWGLFLAHVACAFHFHHHWSHAEAYLRTARRTAELYGGNWGGGLYFNYAFTAAWTLDVLYWWWRPSGHRRRSPALSVAWHGFFLFMVVNATIVFETGPVRWAGVAGLVILSLTWIGKRRKRN